MSLLDDIRPTTEPDEASIAVRVSNLAKTYGLWSSPTARLNYPLLTMARQLAPMPRALAARLDRKRGQLYREFHALEDVSFEIRKGESWGFIGVNGSGKSTLLKVIAGNLRPTRGSVEVDGKVVILDYSSGLNGEFTGRENIYLKTSIFGLTRKEVDRRLQSITDFADIGDFIDQPVKIYSSGMVAATRICDHGPCRGRHHDHRRGALGRRRVFCAEMHGLYPRFLAPRHVFVRLALDQ